MQTICPDHFVSKLREALATLGVAQGSIVYLSTSTALLPKSDRLNENMLDCVTDLVGSDGTVVMPTFSFDFCDQGVFDLKNSSTYCGILSQAFLRRPQVQRTPFSPIHSVAVQGRWRDALVNLRPASGFGPGSPFDWLTSMPVLVCLLGVSVADGVAHVHWLEEKHAVSYREYKPYTGKIILESTALDFIAQRYARKKNANPSAHIISRKFEKACRIATAQIGLFRIKVFLLAEYLNFMDPCFRRNPNILLEAH